MDELVEAYVSVIRARDRLLHLAEQKIREVGLSEPQFNVLRILRGAESPLPTSEVGRRMITRVPDITRLVDRLERLGLVRRHRAPEGDRRRVLVEITAEGRERIAPLDDQLAEHMSGMFDGLSRVERRQLVSLLDRVGIRS
jgi:DNA-binding MarR family transcriptional regulator